METVLDYQSPLAAYLEDHNVGPEPVSVASQPTPPSPVLPASIRRTTSVLGSSRTGRSQLLCLQWAERVGHIYAQIVSSTLGRADNERFLEHFRYTIIASHLLSQQLHPPTPGAEPVLQEATSASLNPILPATFFGAVTSTAAAFAVVWLLDKTRRELSNSFDLARILPLFCLQAVIFALLYGYARRHWLKYLRVQAVRTASEFVNDVHGFETLIVSTLRNVQEVELIAKGYRLSNPLPPISGWDNSGKLRKCPQLRRTLQKLYNTAIPAFGETMRHIRQLTNTYDLERFLDVYDIYDIDEHDDLKVQVPAHLEEQESLAFLRAQQHRFTSVRRLLMCCLLAIPATGTRDDAIRWRTIVVDLQNVSNILKFSQQELSVTQDIDDPLPRPLLSPQLSSPVLGGFNPHLSVVNVNLRTMHAKLQLMCSEAAKLASLSPAKLSSPSFRDEYMALGNEINNLRQAWEAGSVDVNDSVAAVQRSLSNGNLLTTSNSDELREKRPLSTSGIGLGVLGSRLPVSPPLSVASGDELQEDGRRVGTPQTEDPEVFEAVALPMRRVSLSRDQRIIKMQEERERLARLREKREVGTNMIRELQTVINLRPSSTARRNIGNPPPNI